MRTSTSLSTSADAAAGARPGPIRAADRVGSSAIRDLLALTERPDVISLAGGLPNPDSFPVGIVAEAAAGILASGPAALQYGLTEGDPGLRSWIARDHGVAADQVLVTHGSQQALDLVARTLLAPAGGRRGEPLRATVALADPAYVGALQVLRLADVDLLPLPIDADGMRVDVLAEHLAAGRRVDAVYVVPSFDNPSGATLVDDRRAALLALAAVHGFLVLEDDPYRELRFGGAAPRPLRTHAAEARATERLVTLGSFSKVLAPGLRVGYVVASPALVAELAIIKQATDLHTSTFGQRIVAAVVDDDATFAGHLDELRARYRAQADALVTAIDARFGTRAAFVAPVGGMFVWLELDGVDDSDALLARALDHGTAFVPGSAFAVDRGRRAGLRLSFATASPADLDEAVARLARAVDARP